MKDSSNEQKVQSRYFPSVEEMVSQCDEYKTYSDDRLNRISTLVRTADTCLQGLKTEVATHTAAESASKIKPILYDTEKVLKSLQSELRKVQARIHPNVEIESTIESALSQTNSRLAEDLEAAFEEISTMYGENIRASLSSGDHGTRTVDAIVANKINEKLE
ncbi:hypothetical protein [Haloplanus salilacus]|uniref:hypothetical protein n=1 Tax=Haloplanus salilacus TaxID=2949994 RepID=UPI0030D2589A